MILERVGFHMHQLVVLYKRYKRLQDRFVASGAADAQAAAELNGASQKLLVGFAVLGPTIEEHLHIVKDFDFSSAHAQNYLYRTLPELPVSLRYRWNLYVPGSEFADRDIRAEAQFEEKVYDCQSSVAKHLDAAERILPEPPTDSAERRRVRARGVRLFLGAAGTDYCPGLSNLA